MKPTILLTIIILFTGSLFSLRAQDRIIKRDGETITCKVLEIGSKEIKYSLAEYNFEVQFSIEKNLVDKILFENGRELVIDHAAEAMKSTESNSADLFLVQNKNAIKVSFLGPLTGTTTFGYERALKPGQSVEAEIAVIGLAFNNAELGGGSGIGFSAGYKFIRSPDYYLEGMRYAHILKGGYVRPEINFATYQVGSENMNITKFAALLTLGKQWVFSDVFLVDFFVGFGYGYTTDESSERDYYFPVGYDIPIAGKAGFRIGYLF
jgi:hypothetical protein